MSCSSCVKQGCVWCESDNFHRYESVCVCSGLNDGFFGGCDDFSFGSDPLESSVDCTFDSQHGEIFISVLLLIPIAICFLIFCQRDRAVQVTEPSSTPQETPITATEATAVVVNPVPTVDVESLRCMPEPTFVVAVPVDPKPPSAPVPVENQ